jgi:hypothetical protein
VRQELEFVHRSCGAAGYRPSVVSTSLPHLAATGCGHLLLPFVPVRERLRDAVESFFDCHFDLFIEFTGLIRCTVVVLRGLRFLCVWLYRFSSSIFVSGKFNASIKLVLSAFLCRLPSAV